MPLVLHVREDERIIIGNSKDNKDTRIKILDYKKAHDTKSHRAEVTLLISDPEGERRKSLLEGETATIGSATVSFKGAGNKGCAFHFDAPRDVLINREKVFHLKAAEESRGENAWKR